MRVPSITTFPCSRKVHGDLACDVGLNLSDAPIGEIRVADIHARCKNGIQVCHVGAPVLRQIHQEVRMGDSDVNLAELIGSRICHDLISPIGAITNGLELLDMVGGTQGPEMDLISGSVGSAGARIRFFRVAFGSASDQPLGRTEVAELLKDVERAGRVRVNWNLTSGATQSGETGVSGVDVLRKRDALWR